MDESTTYSTIQAAEKLGCADSTVRRNCKRHGIGRRHGRDWLLTVDDIKRLREVVHEGPGNPAWVKPAENAGK